MDQVVFKIYTTDAKGVMGAGDRVRITRSKVAPFLSCEKCKSSSCRHVTFVLSALRGGNLPKFTKVYPATSSLIKAGTPLHTKVEIALGKIQQATGAGIPAQVMSISPPVVPTSIGFKGATEVAVAVQPKSQASMMGVVQAGGLLLDMTPDEMEEVAAEYKAKKAKAVADKSAFMAAESAKAEKAKAEKVNAPAPVCYLDLD